MIPPLQNSSSARRESVVRASTGVLDQITHYYAWGSVYGDMGSGSSLQPFKYGDKELDLSNGVARYDFSARAYFPAIPRFDRPDSYADKYPHLTPYAFCANNPVNITDPTGERIVYFSHGEEWELKEADGEFGFFNAANESYPYPGFGGVVEIAFGELGEGPIGYSLVRKLMSSDTVIHIEETIGGSNFSVSTNTIYWNPGDTSGSPIENEHGEVVVEGRPSFIGLGHECAHAYDKIRGTIDTSPWGNDKSVKKAEIFAGEVENSLRVEHGLPKRIGYDTNIQTRYPPSSRLCPIPIVFKFSKPNLPASITKFKK